MCQRGSLPQPSLRRQQPARQGSPVKPGQLAAGVRDPRAWLAETQEARGPWAPVRFWVAAGPGLSQVQQHLAPGPAAPSTGAGSGPYWVPVLPLCASQPLHLHILKLPASCVWGRMSDPSHGPEWASPRPHPHTLSLHLRASWSGHCARPPASSPALGFKHHHVLVG